MRRKTMSAAAHTAARLQGYIPAIPTPFDRDGSIDRSALADFCERQIHEGAAALVACGTTGEAPTLTRGEHDTVVRIAVDVAAGRVPVIAGAGSNSTVHAIELAQDAEAAGADAILSVVPYYNKPTQAGLYAHFRTITEAAGLPMLLYDVPTRSACGLADETIARLAELPRCVGLKDASGDISRPLRLRALVGSQFRLLSGDDATALAFFAQGGDGCISVTSNVAPGLCRALHLAWRQGDIVRAQQLAAASARLTAALFRESNPVPVKYALSRMNLMSPLVRLPLVELQSETKVEIERVLAQLAMKYSAYLIGGISRQDRRGASDQGRTRPKLVASSPIFAR
jgi:4-hydroxy-tetrahydrodipicolinate synthase